MNIYKTNISNVYKLLNLSRRDVLTINTYNNYESKERKETNQVPRDLKENIQEYLGISLHFAADGKKKDEMKHLVVHENNKDNNNIIIFNKPNDISQYIDDLTYLVIYSKLNNCELNVEREDKELQDIKYNTLFERYELLQASVHVDNNYKIFDTNNNQLNMIDIRENIIDRFSNISLEDIQQYNISFYEFRKIMSLMHENIQLTEKEANAIKLYKASYFKIINKFLRGDINFRDDEVNINEIVQNILDIYSVMQKFELQHDIIVMRAEGNEELLNENNIIYNNFVSTTRMPQLYNYHLEDITQNAFSFITLPKGTHYFPTDLADEKTMNIPKEKEHIVTLDTDYLEGEILLPMCEVIIKDKEMYREKSAIAGFVAKELNCFDIIKKRIEEYKEYISPEEYYKILTIIENREVQENDSLITPKDIAKVDKETGLTTADIENCKSQINNLLDIEKEEEQVK